jgi:hypothetical protein
VTLSGSFTDVGVLDTHTVSVDWGDGGSDPATVVQAAGAGTFSASHQYLDDDPTGTPSDVYTITVTVTDDDMGSGVDTIPITVDNVDPVITSIVSSATFEDKAEEGETLTVSGAFTDVGPSTATRPRSTGATATSRRPRSSREAAAGLTPPTTPTLPVACTTSR